MIGLPSFYSPPAAAAAAASIALSPSARVGADLIGIGSRRGHARQLTDPRQGAWRGKATTTTT